MWDRRARVLEVHDADSCTVQLDQGFGDDKTLKLRLLAVYAPELSQRGGKEALAFVQAWLVEHAVDAPWPWVVTTARTPRSDVEQTTFGRYVGSLTTLDGTESLNAAVSAYVTEKRYPRGTGG